MFFMLFEVILYFHCWYFISSLKQMSVIHWERILLFLAF